MSMLKCEMCGGTLVWEDNGGYAVCEYCGTRIATNQTVNSSNGTTNDTQPTDNVAQINALRIENEKRKSEEAKARAQQARLEAESQQLERERLAEKKRIERSRRSKERRKKLLTVFLTISAIFALGVLVVTVIIPSVKYSSAVKAVEEQRYEDAYLTFKSLYKFKDSQAQASSLLKQYPSIAQVGDIICLGEYEQDNNFSNGKEEIEWKVLEKDQNGKMLVVSKYALDCRSYHSSPNKITWENSEIRSWLNNEFISTAFTSSESASIKTVTNENPQNTDYNVDGGNSTKDRVFLLSIDEAKRYFPKNLDRLCTATSYAASKGTELDSITHYCRWWLRSPGSTQYTASSVKIDGFILQMGTPVSMDKSFVRPAMWIELK
ncbi:MAG: hypothetical protein IKV25_01695 [Clostridia bacterium]|nr:hypothetical protein [Clostridia bacterium]